MRAGDGAAEGRRTARRSGSCGGSGAARQHSALRRAFPGWGRGEPPSPDSDCDLRGAHILPVQEVVRLDPGQETIEMSRLRDDLQIDLVTHRSSDLSGQP
ncbi:MAG: nucleotidyltransferase domain-containing protein [Chloroflexi bacterium]|nr:nucleotidyltransferase domain-containing protein [Chloroflexota bacterium]